MAAVDDSENVSSERGQKVSKTVHITILIFYKK